MLYACLAQTIGSILRALSCPYGCTFRNANSAISDDFLTLSPNTKLSLLYIGQAIGSTANPFVMFLPPRLAGVWFGDDQRALCTSIVSVSGPFGEHLACFECLSSHSGIMVSSVVAPQIVASLSQVPLWSMLVAIACTLTAIYVRYRVIVR